MSAEIKVGEGYRPPGWLERLKLNREAGGRATFMGVPLEQMTRHELIAAFELQARHERLVRRGYAEALAVGRKKNP